MMDVFNRTERVGQRGFRHIRDRMFGPLVFLFARMRFSPNRVTLLGLVFLLGACWFGPDNPWGAPFLLLLYCLMDGLDGALARSNGLSSKAGALLDIVADQAGVVLISAAAIHHIGADGVPAVLFSGFYIAFIIVVVYANELLIQIPFFIRVKYALYVVYVIDLFHAQGLTTRFMWLFAPYYAVMFAVAVKSIHDGLTRPRNGK